MTKLKEFENDLLFIANTGRSYIAKEIYDKWKHKIDRRIKQSSDSK